MKPICHLLPLACALWTAAATGLHAQTFTFGTLAGNPSVVDADGNPLGGYADGINRQARFNFPLAVTVDEAGTVFVADTLNNAIRAIRPVYGDWMVTTVAGAGPAGSGSADGTNSQAQFNIPQGLAVDRAGCLYVADTLNFVIRKIAPVGNSWVVSTIAGAAGQSGTNDGVGAAARFSTPVTVAVDGATNVYVGDYTANTIRKLTLMGTDWIVSTIAGMCLQTGSADGTNSQARFNGPGSLAADSAGNVYVSDWYNSIIRRISPAGTNYVVTTIAGKAGNADWVDGTGSNARFTSPLGGIGVDTTGNLYVTDAGMVRKVAPSGTNWVVTTIAGAYGQVGAVDGVGSNVRFYYPQAVAADGAGNLYVADSNNNAIRTGVLPSAAPTPLRIACDGSAVILSWPLSAAAFMPESRSSILPGASWKTITNTPGIADTSFVLTNATGTTNTLYRLRLH